MESNGVFSMKAFEARCRTTYEGKGRFFYGLVTIDLVENCLLFLIRGPALVFVLLVFPYTLLLSWCHHKYVTLSLSADTKS